MSKPFRCANHPTFDASKNSCTYLSVQNCYYRFLLSSHYTRFPFTFSIKGIQSVGFVMYDHLFKPNYMWALMRPTMWDKFSRDDRCPWRICQHHVYHIPKYFDCCLEIRSDFSQFITILNIGKKLEGDLSHLSFCSRTAIIIQSLIEPKLTPTWTLLRGSHHAKVQYLQFIYYSADKAQVFLWVWMSRHLEVHILYMREQHEINKKSGVSIFYDFQFPL